MTVRIARPGVLVGVRDAAREEMARLLDGYEVRKGSIKYVGPAGVGVDFWPELTCIVHLTKEEAERILYAYEEREVWQKGCRGRWGGTLPYAIKVWRTYTYDLKVK